MNERFPSKAEQIEALLHHKAGKLLLECRPHDEANEPQYIEIFNVTRKEIEKYAKQHYKMSDLISVSPGLEDDFYVIPIPDGYLTYYQTREIRFDEIVVKSEDEAWKLLVDFMLLTSGTGIKFE